MNADERKDLAAERQFGPEVIRAKSLPKRPVQRAEFYRQRIVSYKELRIKRFETECGMAARRLLKDLEDKTA